MSRPTFLVLGGFRASDWEDIWQRGHEWTVALMKVGNVIYLERAAAGRGGWRRVASRVANVLRTNRVPAERHVTTPFPARPEFVSWLQLPSSTQRGWRGNARRALDAAEARRRELGWAEFSLVQVGTASETWIELGSMVDAPVWFDSAERFLYSAAYADVDREMMKRQVVESALVTTDTELTRSDWRGVRDDISVVPHGAKSWAAEPDWSCSRVAPYYVGSLHPALDTDFLSEVARLSGKNVVMVGDYPADTAGAGLEFAGWVAGGDIPRRLSDATAGLVPYQGGEWRQGVYPSKVYDYFLAGAPAISTRLPALDGLEWAWQVDTAEEADEALRRAEALTDDHRRAIRAFALANTWDERFARVSALLADAGVRVDG